MDDGEHPVVVAFDGSDESKAALTAAAGLFGGHTLLVVSVWESGLAMMTEYYPAPEMAGYAPLPDPEQVAAVDASQREHASAVAEAGARLARDLGATAEALAVPDSSDVPETILAIAEERGAGALVVGSRGLGSIRSQLFGSTSRRLLHESRRPVLVVRKTD